tara:strand:- start:1644 stop:2804 length:1161 start_codon:yes stop_codon:yes gene_type:complete
MATLVKHRKQYCSIIRNWNGIKQVTTKIPLRTDKKDVAVVRHTRVSKSESHIKSGIIKKNQFKGYFEWLNDEGTSVLKEYTLAEAIEQFVKAHSVNVSEGSIKRIEVSMKCLLNVLNKNTPIKQIKTSDMEQFKAKYQGIHSIYGINLNLRNIKTFLRYCVDEKMLNHMPKIKMLREPKKMPKYLSEDNLNALMNVDNVSDFMKRIFYLLVTSGCRRSEVVDGTLDGKILIVPASLSKSRIEKEISLNDIQVSIVKEIHIARDTHLLKGYKLSNFKGYITKAFQKGCKRIGLQGYNLHNLRDTFAVTQWIVSNDIYEVKNLLGHTSVKTTERYAQFNLDRLAQDFPSAYQVRIEVEKVRKNGISTPLISTPLTISEESSSNNIGMS